MHSSRMRAVRCRGCLGGGVSDQGVCLRGFWPEGGVCPRGVCPGGVSAQGGVCPGGWCLPREGVCLACLPGGCLPRQTLPPLWTEFLTHACENITFPQLLLRTAIIMDN